MELPIKGFQKLSLIDFPDRLCATLFVGHCNFRCAFCYNVDLVVDPENLPTISEEWVLSFLSERRGFLDGLCLGGGEPTIHDRLPAFLAKVKDLRYLIKVDTNGSQPDMLNTLIHKQLVDYLAMDVKAPLEDYEKVVRTSINIEAISKSIQIIQTSNIDYEFRTTVVPGLIGMNELVKIAQELKSSKRYVIQQFKPGTTLDRSLTETYPLETLKGFQEIIHPYFGECLLRH